MKRLTTSLKKLQNPMGNPIIVKELRSRMRGARAFITLTGVLILMALFSYGLYQLVILTSTWSYSPLSPQIGQTLFVALAVLEMLMICMVTPAVTAGAISNEHEKLTYEMLLTTPLKPTRILWGKLFSALSYIFLLIFAAIPMVSLVFIYGGVAPREMLKALVVLISTAIMLGTIGIFMSTWLKRSGRATIASYLIVLGMLGAPTVIYGIVGVLRQAEPPRWLLVASPINALFSAIAPSTSLGNSSISMIGGLSMLMGGNLGTMISTDSIPRPLYHYTLPLYGLITLVLYLFATRLIRPARRWQLKAKEIIIALTTILVFAALIGLGFSISANRYENISIFATPTPFMPMPVEPMMEQVEFAKNANGFPISDTETISAYTAIFQAIHDEGILANIKVAAISKQTYIEPSAPEFQNQKNITSVIFADDILEGITVAVDDLPFELIWVDDYEALSLDVLGDPDKKGDALILFGQLNPLETGLIALNATVYYPDQFSQTLTFDLSNQNGFWEVINFKTSQATTLTSKPQEQELHLTFDEMAEIYAGAVSQAYLVDNPTPETEIAELYLLQSTGLAVDSIILSPEVQSNITEALAIFPFKTIWVENLDDTSIGSAANNASHRSAIVTFGRILQHDYDGAVEVMIEVYFGEGNGILATYILENIDGEWQVTEFGGMG